MFENSQILKDLKENALITILTSSDNDDINDSFNLLNVDYSTLTPLINIKFSEKDLNKEDLIKTFCSYVYIKNYMKTIKIFTINNNLTRSWLKEYITYFFNEHNIYFYDFPYDNLFAVTIRTGNINIKA